MEQFKSTELISTTIQVSHINITGRASWVEQFCEEWVITNVSLRNYIFSLKTNALKNELVQKLGSIVEVSWLSRQVRHNIPVALDKCMDITFVSP